MVDDEAPRQHPPTAMMSAPPASNPPPAFMNHHVPLPDIRPICTLADAADALSRVATDNDITSANDNANAAILASLSTATLLPHSRGGNVVSPTAQLQLLCSDTSSPDSNNSSDNITRRSNKKCSVVTCNKCYVQGGVWVCMEHGTQRRVCQVHGCNKLANKANGYCSAHTTAKTKTGCDVPGCSYLAARGGKCSMHSTTRCLCKGCLELACIGGYCQHHRGAWGGGTKETLMNNSNHQLTSHDGTYHNEETNKRASVRQPTSSLDLLCSVTMQSLREDEKIAEAKEYTSKGSESLASKLEYKRRPNCGKCEACIRKDCGECKPCLDKPKFGGRNTLKRRCSMRQCLNAKQKVDTEAVVEEAEHEEYDEVEEVEENDYEEVVEEEAVVDEVVINQPESQFSKPRRIDKRGGACGECEACLRDDCGECKHCLDKAKFGGQNKIKKKCCKRECFNKQGELDEEAGVDTEVTGDDGVCLSRGLESNAAVDKVETAKLDDDNNCLNSRDDKIGNIAVFVDKVKSSDDRKYDGKRMKAELAKIKAELDVKANGKKYGLKPPQYPTFNYSAADDDADHVQHKVDGDEVYSSDEDDNKGLEAASSSSRSGKSASVVPSAGIERGVTIRPSGKWQVQLFYAGASRYIGLFDSREDAAVAYETARECMSTFSDLDPTPEQIMRNLDMLRKAAIFSAEPKKKGTKSICTTAKVTSKGDTSHSDKNAHVVATLTKAEPTKVKPSSGVHASRSNKATAPAASRNRQVVGTLTMEEPTKFEASSWAGANSAKSVGKSPSRLKTPVTKVEPSKIEAKAKSAGDRSPTRSKPLVVQSSSSDAVQNESTAESQKRKDMSSIYEKAMKVAEELPRGITVRPSGKWQVQIYYAGKSRYLGVFDSKLEAAVAYELARECCSTFERDPSPEEAAKNVILIRNAAFTVQTKGLDSEPGKKKKRKTK